MEDRAELQRTTDLLQQAEQVGRFGSWGWNFQTGESWWSAGMYTIYGRDPSLGPPPSENDKWLETIYPDDRPPLQDTISAAISRIGPYEAEYRLRREDDQVRTILGRGNVLGNKDGQPERIVGIAMDITERKQAEQALRQSESDLKAAQRFSKVGSWTWNIQTNQLTWSDEMYRIFGLDPDSFDGDLDQVMAQAIHPDDRAIVEASNRSVITKGEPVPVEYRVIWPDGTIRTVWAEAGELIRDQDEKPLLLKGYVQDITARKEAEAALKQLAANLARSQHVGKLGSWDWDLANDELSWSDELYRIWDLDPETELTYEFIAGRIHPDDQALNDKAVRELVSSHNEGAFEFRIVCPNSQIKHIHQTIEVDREPTGQATRMFGIMQDVTPRAQAEQALAQLNADLEQRIAAATQELRDAQEQLVRREKLAALGQMAGSLGHELRNPLGVISNAVYYLKLVLPDADESIGEYLELVSSEVDKATQIITDLLDFARIKSINRQPLALDSIVHSVLIRYPATTDIALETTIPPDTPPVLVDARQLEQILVNLVTNAYQAMPDGGTLTISANPQGEQVRLSITDSGCGIPVENLSKIFEPLFTTKPRGIGLGLAIAKSLIEANQGRIEFESVDGQGATFTLILPVAPKPDGSTDGRQPDA